MEKFAKCIDCGAWWKLGVAGLRSMVGCRCSSDPITIEGTESQLNRYGRLRPDAKYIEVRDSMTFIPAMAIAVDGRSPLAGRAGFAGRSIMLVRLSDQESHLEPYQWGSETRTMGAAHSELLTNWTRYASGDVLDVQYVLGETSEPKASEVQR